MARENYHNKVKGYTDDTLVHVAMMGLDVRHGENWAGKQVNIKTDLEPDYYHIGSFPRESNGKIYYVPGSARNLCSVVIINMELLEEIGGKVPENYDELKTLAALCEEKGIDCLTAFGGLLEDGEQRFFLQSLQEPREMHIGFKKLQRRTQNSRMQDLLPLWRL